MLDSDLALNVIKRAESNDIDGAEVDLTNYYDDSTIKCNLQELGQLTAFRPRIPLAQKALIDYNKKRYHSSVPIVLALLDGMVTDAFLDAGGHKLSLPADEINIHAWNSVADHGKAFKALVGILKRQRGKTVSAQIDKPYRHGILHGMDLGYDNQIVAAKAWAALFAFRDWAEKAEKGLLNIKFDKKIDGKPSKISMAKGSLIRDIPTIKKAQQNLDQLKDITGLMPIFCPLLSQLGGDTKQIEDALPNAEKLEAWEEMLAIPDRFNYLFAERGWIYYDSMNCEVAKAVIQMAESGDIDGAEIVLVNYYDEDTVRSKIKRMKDVEAFRPRGNLSQKALADYLAGRYYACVPIVLAMIEGIVNESHGKGWGKKLGFSATEVNLEAWDSISGHPSGLKVIASVFNEDRGKTIVDPITIPYRNGILHGMDLGYDNKMVAAKAWAALFSLRDWAIKAEKGLLEPQTPEKPITLIQVAEQTRDTKAENLELSEWKPRVIKIGQDIPATGSPEMYDAGTSWRRLAEFFSFWKDSKPNFRAMADCVVLDSDDNPREMPRRIEKLYNSKHLESFKFTDICERALLTTIIQVMLVYEEYGARVEKSVRFIMNKGNQVGRPENSEKAGSSWYIRFWDLV